MIVPNWHRHVSGISVEAVWRLGYAPAHVRKHWVHEAVVAPLTAATRVSTSP